MVQRIGGSRRKTRHKLSKNVRYKGKISLANYFQDFKEGDKVYLVAEPSIHTGTYHGRFHGKAGVVLAKRGTCYEIQIHDFKMAKTLIDHPVHLKRQ